MLLCMIQCLIVFLVYREPRTPHVRTHSFPSRRPSDLLGSLPEQSAFSPTTLTWRLYGWLCEPANLELAPRLAQYLDGGDERRRLSLAAKIADVFDQYLLYRDDWLAAWERGETFDLGPDEAWQALLWRELTKRSEEHTSELQSIMRTPYAV